MRSTQSGKNNAIEKNAIKNCRLFKKTFKNIAIGSPAAKLCKFPVQPALTLP